MDSGEALLVAVVTALKADADVAAIVDEGVFSDVPQGTEMPYVLVSLEAQPFAAADFSGMAHRLRLQCFSQEPSQKPVLALRKACLDALDRQEGGLSVTGFSVVSMQFAYGPQPLKEDDGRTWQAIGELDVLVQ